MAKITDLTNTTWEIPAGWSATQGTSSQFSVNIQGYISLNNVQYNLINLYSSNFRVGITVGGSAKNNNIYVNLGASNNPSYLDFTNTNAFTLHITGGSGATNTSLISWLEANGTLQGGSEPVTIKAGTYTWNETIPQSGWCSGTTVKGVNFQHKVNTTSKGGFWYSNIDEETYTTDWQLADDEWTLNKYIGYTFASKYWANGTRTFTVETDQEVTGDDAQGFMDYLTAYSDYGSQSEPEQTDTKPIYKRVNGAWVKLTAFERVNGAWVKISSADGGTEEPEVESVVGTWLFNETIPAFPTKITTSVKGTFSAKNSTSSANTSSSYRLSTYNINQIIFATSTYVVEIKDSTSGTDGHTTRYNINSSQWESQCMSGGSGGWKPYTTGDLFTQVRTITITEDPNDATFAEYLRTSATKIA